MWSRAISQMVGMLSNESYTLIGQKRYEASSHRHNKGPVPPNKFKMLHVIRHIVWFWVMLDSKFVFVGNVKWIINGFEISTITCLIHSIEFKWDISEYFCFLLFRSPWGWMELSRSSGARILQWTWVWMLSLQYKVTIVTSASAYDKET